MAFSGALCRRLASELPEDTEALMAVDMAALQALEDNLFELDEKLGISMEQIWIYNWFIMKHMICFCASLRKNMYDERNIWNILLWISKGILFTKGVEKQYRTATSGSKWPCFSRRHVELQMLAWILSLEDWIYEFMALNSEKSFCIVSVFVAPSDSCQTLLIPNFSHFPSSIHPTKYINI